jgi:hypothetical protein
MNIIYVEKSKVIPVPHKRPWKFTGAFLVIHEHHLYIKIEAIPVIGHEGVEVLPVKYESRLHIKIKVSP